jgi:hypothetical protein
MNETVRGVWIALFAGLVGGVVVLVSWPAPVVQVSSVQNDVLDRVSLEDLEHRLRVLESASERTREARSVRTLLDPGSTTGEDSASAALARQVADLRKRLGSTPWGSNAADADRVLEILDRLRTRPGESSSRADVQGAAAILRARARIPLRIRFLEQWGTDVRAHRQLVGLVGDLLALKQRARARLELDRLGPRTDIAKWRVDVLRLRASIPGSAAVAIAGRVASSAADLPTQAWAMRRMGDSLEAMGERGRAIQTFETLIARFRHCTGAQRHVSWARDRRDLLAKAR